MKISKFPASRWTKWVVLISWIALIVIGGSLGGKLSGLQKNDPSALLPQNAESTQVVNLSKKFTAGDVYFAVVVYDHSGAPVTAADQALVAADAQRFAHVARVHTPIAGPVRAKDGRALQLVVPIKVGRNGSTDTAPAVKAMRSILKSHHDLSAHVTGPAGYAADSTDAFSGTDTTLLYVTLAIVIAILLLTYRSPVLWLLPLICVVAALIVAQGVIYLLARYAGVPVIGESQFLLTVLVFGAGTDYALLLIARYREELRRHEDRHEAMVVAVRRAGPAILASGTTVALSLLCLLLAELNSTKSLGPVMAVGVTSAMATMITLLPALLVIAGRWVFWPVRPRFGSAEPIADGLWKRIGNSVARRPRTVWVVTAVVLGAMALGLAGLKAGALQNKDTFRHTTDAITGEQVVARHFPVGSGDPVQVIGAASTARTLESTVAATPGITGVTSPVVRDGYAYVEGTLTATTGSKAAFATVDRLREAVHAIPGAHAKVGGGSAVSLDLSRASRHDQDLVVPLVLAVVLLILGLLLRALLAPLILLATVVLSFAAALGISALAFDHLFGFAGVDPSLPLWTFVFLIALGIDYNIFLMTRVHEESRRHGTRRGALLGLRATGGTITSAGVVLAGTFAALTTLPLVYAVELGFAVAFGVLLDTFVVRSVLVTALTYDIGRRMWWPSSMSRDTVKTDLGEHTRQDLAQTPNA